MSKIKKYDKKELFQIFKKTKTLKDFKLKTKSKNINKNSLTTMFYDFKKNEKTYDKKFGEVIETDPNIHDISHNAQNSEDIINLSPSDVVVKTQESSTEAASIKDMYKNMYEETARTVDSNKSEDSDYTGEDNEETESFANDNSEKLKYLKVNKILYSIGMALNNNLIWKDAPIEKNSIEEQLIAESSEDVEASIGIENLKSEEAPWGVYLLAVFAVPMISRIDKLPEKVNGLLKWLGLFKPSPREKPTDVSYNVKTESEAPQQQSNNASLDKMVNLNGNLYPESLWNELSDAAKIWFSQNADAGYKISPTYIHGKTLDYEAFRDNHIIRNQGDTFIGN
jgi:hypothetical protein